MAITIELPEDIERDLRARSPDLDAWAKLAYALDLYRAHSISAARLAGIVEPAWAAIGDDVAPADTPGVADVAAFDFHAEDHDRVNMLSAKAQEGTLTPGERDELEAIVRLDSMMSVLRLGTSGPVGASR